MPIILDSDPFFTGELQGSAPKAALQQGQISRLLNGRFVEGAITNAVALEELNFTYFNKGKNVYTSNVSYEHLMYRGEIQLYAPLSNKFGEYHILLVNGILLQIDCATGVARDITPTDSMLPKKGGNLTYLDNDLGVYGIGGYLIIYNYPNRPIFVNHLGARVSNELTYEMPPSRMGVTASNKALVVTGDNLFAVSDPFGGSNSLAPLTFAQTYEPGGLYEGDIYTVGSPLDEEYITCVSRLPKYLGPNQDFIAQNVLIHTKYRKYIIALGANRADWSNIAFQTYAGNSDGAAGPLASTNVGSSLVYTSTQGRVKLITQDQQKETSYAETFFDDALGQYVCANEVNFHHRNWYKDLDHSKSILKYVDNNLFATVYPTEVPCIDRWGNEYICKSNAALAIASIDSRDRIGANAPLSWEGFYTDINPVGIMSMGNKVYIASKDSYGRNKFYKLNYNKSSTSTTVLYTRGYMLNDNSGSKKKALSALHLYFRVLQGCITTRVYQGSNNKWEKIGEVTSSDKLHKFSGFGKHITDSSSIPLKIEIDHKGCKFELESISLLGEALKGM